MNMVKKFKVGDLVFAKLKGYPPWPAKIIEYKNKKYKVVFYGTKDNARIEIENLYGYQEHKTEFLTEKNFKRFNFYKAFVEIEAEIKGEVPADLQFVIDNTANKIQGENEVGKVVKETFKAKSQSKDSRNISHSVFKTKSKDHLEEDRRVTAHQAKRKVPVEASATVSFKETAANAPNTKTEVIDNMILTVVPPGAVIGIKTDYNKPVYFTSVFQRLQWEATARREAEEIKENLEIGLIELHSVRDRLILDVPIEELNAEISQQFITEIKRRHTALAAETDFMVHCQQIRECLGWEHANVDKCLKLLDNFKKLELNRIMMLCNPDCVDIIRQLCHYEGNTKHWQLNDDEALRFMTNAKIIRRDAVYIYNKLKMLCNYSGEKDFWDEFTENAKIFKEVTKNINKQYLAVLNEKLYQKLLIKQANETFGKHKSNSKNLSFIEEQFVR